MADLNPWKAITRRIKDLEDKVGEHENQTRDNNASYTELVSTLTEDLAVIKAQLRKQSLDLAAAQSRRSRRQGDDAPSANTADGTLEQLQEKLRRLEATIFFKDESLKSMQEANKGLIEQLKGRWTFLQLMLSFLTFSFAINFGYQIYKTSVVEEVGRDASAALNALTKQTNEQAKILAAITQSTTTLNNGQRDSNRGRHSLAAQRAVIAGEKMKEALGRITAFSQQEKAPVDIVTPLRPAVEETLMACYELEARSHFFLANEPGADYAQSMKRMMDVADRMIQLRKESWQGYHFRGLYLTDFKPIKPAEEAYKTALKYDNELKIDIINLAELYFINEKFPYAMDYAEAYLRQDPNPSLEHQVVCRFFALISHYLSDASTGKEVEEFKKYLNTILVDKGKPIKLPAKNYSFEVLKKFADGIGTINLTHTKYASRRSAVKSLIYDLYNRAKE